MPQVSVTIDGKSYRMACGEGEQDRLAALAADLDARVGGLRRSFGEIGDMRLQVMAALTLIDELSEAKVRLATVEDEVRGFRNQDEARADQRMRESSATAAHIVRTAERIDRMVRALGRSAHRPGSNDEPDIRVSGPTDNRGGQPT